MKAPEGMGRKEIVHDGDDDGARERAAAPWRRRSVPRDAREDHMTGGLTIDIDRSVHRRDQQRFVAKKPNPALP